MKTFAFFLMVAVAGAGVLGGYRLITGKDLLGPDGPWASAVVDGGSSVAAPRGMATATALPTAAPEPTAAPTPAPPTATPAPEPPQVMVVGNTDGIGVYVRRSPRMADRLRAWVDGTRMEIIGRVEVEGRTWMKVRSPDGAEGYVPEQYLVTP